MTTTEPTSPRWGATTKLVIALTAVALIAWALARFQFLVVPLISAAMIAYLFQPVITFLSHRLRWPRWLAVAVVYLVLLVAFLSLVTGLGIYIVGQIAGLNLNVQRIITDLPARIDQLTHSQYTLFGFTLDLSQFNFSATYDQIASAIQPVLAQAGTIAGQAFSNTAEFVGWLVFVLLISFYMAKDVPNWVKSVSRHMEGPGYHHDATHMMHEFQNIWDAFLRGQLILAVTIFLVDWIGLSILNVRYAFVLGLIAGLLEFIPSLGPITAGIIGISVALFQPSNWFGLSPIPYAITVAIFYFLVQQTENYVLVPRIIGQHLDLHPVAIMVAAIMGASMGGIIGLLLAAPSLATLKLVGRYAWRKMLDLPPFPPEEEQPHRPQASAFSRLDWRGLLNRFRRQQPSSAPSEQRVNKK